MIDILKAGGDFLKLSETQLVIVAVASGIFLWCKPELLELLAVEDFAKNYRPWFGIAFLISVVSLGVITAKSASNLVARLINAVFVNRGIHQALEALAEHEKEILRFYFVRKVQLAPFQVPCRYVAELERKNILSGPVAVDGASLTGAKRVETYTITKAAWQRLSKHLALFWRKAQKLANSTPMANFR